MDKKQQHYNDACIKTNLQAVDFCRSAFGAVSGMGAGVLGLTGFGGFLFYAVTSLWMSAVLAFVYTRGMPSTVYFRSSLDIWWNGIAGNALSFVLFWTYRIQSSVEEPGIIINNTLL